MPSSLREQRELVAGDVLVARLGALVGRGQVHPELHAVQQAAFAQHLLGRHLGVHEAGARGHPLRVAAADHAAPAVGVAVLHLAVEQVGDGLEAAVRVVGRAQRLAGQVVDRPHLVEHEERVGAPQVERAGERTAHGEARTLERGDRGRDLRDRPGHAGRVGDGANGCVLGRRDSRHGGPPRKPWRTGVRSGRQRPQVTPVRVGSAWNPCGRKYISGGSVEDDGRLGQPRRLAHQVVAPGGCRPRR